MNIIVLSTADEGRLIQLDSLGSAKLWLTYMLETEDSEYASAVEVKELTVDCWAALFQ